MKTSKIMNELSWIFIFGTLIFAYIQNLTFVLNINSFQLKMGEDLISIIGCFIPPIGVIHTFYNWYNYVL